MEEAFLSLHFTEYESVLERYVYSSGDSFQIAYRVTSPLTSTVSDMRYRSPVPSAFVFHSSNT